jgi:hypothetical protein
MTQKHHPLSNLPLAIQILHNYFFAILALAYPVKQAENALEEYNICLVQQHVLPNPKLLNLG